MHVFNYIDDMIEAEKEDKREEAGDGVRSQTKEPAAVSPPPSNRLLCDSFL